LSTRCHPAKDIDIIRKTWSTGLDPSQFEMERRPYGSKVLIDACKPHRHLKLFPEPTLLRCGVYERVAARWAEFGFSEPPPKLTTFYKE
jgi:3-polyprenyl-4-hydroxybenzoate decarboxylase